MELVQGHIRKDVITMPNKDPISIVNEHTIFTFTEIDENAVFSDDSPHCVVIEYTEFGPRPHSMRCMNSTGEFILVFPSKDIANHCVSLCRDTINGRTKIEKLTMIENQKELKFAVLSKIEFNSNATNQSLYEHNAHTVGNITMALRHYTTHHEMPYPSKCNINFSLREEEYV